MKIARIHVDGAEVATFEQIINVVEENVICVHVNHALVLEHVPHVEFVQRVLEVILVTATARHVLFVSSQYHSNACCTGFQCY